jgi:hypothetical protein
MGAVHLLALVAFFAACDKQWTTPVADVDCGGFKLRFEEQGKYLAAPVGSHYFRPALKMNDGSGWVAIEENAMYEPACGYSSLLPASARFHPFPVTPERTEDPYHHPPWTLYVDPAKIAPARYDAICACIDRNIATIDGAWDKPRDPAANFDLSTDRRFRLASALHVAFDSRFAQPDRTTLGMRWECPGGTFIKTETPNMLVFCSIEERVTGIIGHVSADQKHAELWDASKLIPVIQRTTGGHYREFYGQCRDSAGKSLYATLSAID